MEQEKGKGIFVQKTEEEVIFDLKKSPDDYRRFLGWDDESRRLFLAFCTGKRTLPVLYDTVFKKLMSPTAHPGRLEDCISCLLGQQVKIREVLPNEDILMDGETHMIMDILVELTDGALVLVEIQKVPYYFPGERASCYSADLLLRQYTRVKREKGKAFSYRDLQKVYTIVFFEKSTGEFKKCHGAFVHHGQTVFNTELRLRFLQEYYLVALDVFAKSEYAKAEASKERLYGWLSFMGTTGVEDAVRLCKVYPWLSELYQELAGYAKSPREMMGMFSEMLRELDRNTVKYMVDDMREKIEKQEAELAEKDTVIAKKDAVIAEKDAALAENASALAKKDTVIAEKDAEIKRLREILQDKLKH